MNKADVVFYLFDLVESRKHKEISDEVFHKKDEFEKAGIKYVLVGNKVDEAGEAHAKEAFMSVREKVFFISAKNKENIGSLKQALYNLVAEGRVKQEGTIVTNARHYGALTEVLKSLLDIKTGLDNNIPGDLISLDIRRCLYYLGEITGEVTTEDKLDYIFSKFCIGK